VKFRGIPLPCGGRSTNQLAFLTSPLLPLKLQRTPLTSLRPIHTIYNLADQLKSVNYAIASVGTLVPDSQSPATQMRETKKAELFRVRPFLLGETTQPVLPPFPSN
jgi:hypothetical protein